MDPMNWPFHEGCPPRVLCFRQHQKQMSKVLSVVELTM